MKKKKPKLRNWTLPEVEKCLPYVKSLLATIRTETIASNCAKSYLRRLTKKGVRDRQYCVAVQENQTEADTHQRAAEDAIAELAALDIVCHDPIQSVALFPFRMTHESGGFQPCWFGYSPFGNEVFWRNDDEDAKSRRDVRDLVPEPV